MNHSQAVSWRLCRSGVLFAATNYRLEYPHGRYLLISSSRPGGLPANLQGLWNNSTKPPWNCDHHLNINLQMNSRPAGSVNGLKARGNFEVDMAWKDGRLTTYRIRSPEPREVKVRVNGEVKTVKAEPFR